MPGSVAIGFDFDEIGTITDVDGQLVGSSTTMADTARRMAESAWYDAQENGRDPEQLTADEILDFIAGRMNGRHWAVRRRDNDSSEVTGQ